MSTDYLGVYESFIHKSRYARYLPEKKRREHWAETIQRYCDFVLADADEHTSKTLYDAMIDMKIMPSMRALMSAGKAAERDNTALYNCSFIAIDDPKAFDEMMVILMNGTGVGFSVERQYINQLPEVPDKLYDSDTTIIVKDSKEGWGKALRQLIALLYTGEIPKWDTSKLRKAGARLKTFGGRSSGPEPLEELFRFVVRIFRQAIGRRLTSLECHDIACKIGEVVVVGGVRRSALISLSNLSDDRMRHAKSGAWWEANPQRSLSNNSAVYTEKPETGPFLTEWLSLYESKSGERGIINREAMTEKVRQLGRRDPDHAFGVNPCGEIILRPNQFCNLTEVIVRGDDTLETLTEKVRLATILGTFQSRFTYFPYLRKVWTKNTEEERLLGVSLTGIYDNKLINNPNSKTVKGILDELRREAIETNRVWAEKLNIPQSAAITCVKPSGTVSELTDTSSGIHPRHAKYYIRRVRSDLKDPLTKFLQDAGVPWEPDVMRPHSTVVFSFVKKAPSGALTKDDVSAIDHLKLWMIFQQTYCEHNPSVTVSIKENEWMSVGAFVYENFDAMTGVSFLPYDGGVYKQAPYEEITKDQYDEMMSKFPKELNWDSLNEVEDSTEGQQQLACVSGGCEI